MPRHLVDHLAIRVDSQLSVFAVSFL
jgi:hypothetical protein